MLAVRANRFSSLVTEAKVEIQLKKVDLQSLPSLKAEERRNFLKDKLKLNLPETAFSERVRGQDAKDGELTWELYN